METKQVADLIGTTPDTIRRWASQDYTAFLSPAATPPKGDERRFSEHDLKVLTYVGAARNTGTPHDKIRSALADMRANDWSDLPSLPDEWKQPPQDGRIAVSEAGDRAQHLAEMTALQIQVVNLRDRLQEATERTEKLERELDHARTTKEADQAQIHDLELKLKEAEGEVQALNARLSSYAITGGEKPIPVALIIVVTAVVAVVLVLVVLVVVRLVL